MHDELLQLGERYGVEPGKLATISASLESTSGTYANRQNLALQIEKRYDSVMSQSPDLSNEPTSLTLLRSVKANDPAAWRRLVQLYSPAIFHWAKRTGLQDEDAADILQEVWTSVTQALEHFQRTETSGTFRGWLYTITRNKIYDRARKADVIGTGGTNAQLAIQNMPEVESLEETLNGSAGMVERALEMIRADFEPHNWQAFWRTTIQGESPRDVAADLGIAANAVHQAKFRILKRLRQELNSLGINDDPSFAGLLAQP